MNKILLILVMCVLVSLVSSIVFSQAQQGPNDVETGIKNSESKESVKGSGQGLETETKTQNKGQDSKIQTQEEAQVNNPNSGEQVRTQNQVQSGSITVEGGKQVQVQTQSNNQIRLKSGNAEAKTTMKMSQEQTETGTKLQVQLSNGKNAEVKIMPDTASERAIERLRIKVCSAENGCTIELKEVGTGEQVKAAYEIRVQKKAKFLGLFGTKMQVRAQVDAENGEIIQTKKPWWAFLTAEAAE